LSQQMTVNHKEKYEKVWNFRFYLPLHLFIRVQGESAAAIYIQELSPIRRQPVAQKYQVNHILRYS